MYYIPGVPIKTVGLRKFSGFCSIQHFFFSSSLIKQPIPFIITLNHKIWSGTFDFMGIVYGLVIFGINFTQGANRVLETWAVVKGSWVWACSEDISAHFLCGLPSGYSAGKKWQPFFKMAAMRMHCWRILEIMNKQNLYTPCATCQMKGHCISYKMIPWLLHFGAICIII